MKAEITLAMIVKNEAAHLESCLVSVKDQVDEIVIVDTGSTDNTLEIAKRYTSKIYHYPWDGDFSAARNFSLGQAGGDWILCLDADEKLLAGTGCLKDLIQRDPAAEVYFLPLNNPTSVSAAEYNRVHVLRFFKNNGRYGFQGKIHEHVIIHDEKVVRIAEGPVINHKLSSRKERKRKRARNLTMLKKAAGEDPSNPFLQYYLSVEWLLLDKPDRAYPFLQQAYQTLPETNLQFCTPALSSLILCSKALGKNDEAICLCLEGGFKYPQYTDVYYLGGILFEEQKEYQVALKWFQQAVQCGTPPALYNHMNGAGDFLAYFHLGYCHQKLGHIEEARDCYEKALHKNPGHIYPVYNLFLILFSKYGPDFLQRYLEEKRYWDNVDIALAVAQLFHLAGQPALSYRCLNNWQINDTKPDEIQFYLGKYSICSGEPERGINYLSRISADSAFYFPAQLQWALALLLLDRLAEGRTLARQLWKNRAARGESRVLLWLISFLEGKEPKDCPERIRNREVLPIVKEIFDQVSSCRYSGFEPGATRRDHLLSGLEVLIKQISFAGYLTLVQHLQQKTKDTRQQINSKFGIGLSERMSKP